jgi:hypothetical protein
MKSKFSALPDLLSLRDVEKRVYLFVLDNWPATPLEVAENFNESISSREQKKRASTKYAYYLKKLVAKKLLLSKKAGNSIIVWPLLVEKYRAIHNILKHQEAEHIALASEKIHSKEILNELVSNKGLV